MEDEDTELLLTDEAPETEEGVEVEAEEETPQEIDPESLSLDDDDIEEDGDDWPAKLRKRYKEAQRENAILKRENETFKASTAPVAELPPRPKAIDFDYDQEAHEAALDEWEVKRAAFAVQQATTRPPDQDLRDEVVADVTRFREGIAALAFPDKDEAVAIVQQVLPESHQLTIAQAARDGGTVIYALSKSPKKMAELAAIKNPVKLALAVRDIEDALGMKTTRKPPAPATSIRGDATATTTDKRLAELEKEADTTGNRTNLIKYKKEKGLI